MQPMMRRSKVEVEIPIDLFVERLQSLRIFEIWFDIDFLTARDTSGRYRDLLRPGVALQAPGGECCGKRRVLDLGAARLDARDPRYRLAQRGL